MKHYNHITTLSDNTPVSIDFESDGFTVQIGKMTDLNTGDAICPDLLGEINADELNAELMEFAAEIA
jgi:hypothetical protein